MLDVLLPALLALLACLLGGLCHLGAFRRRRAGEPPLDRGAVPWLGHVLEFRWDTAKFLERMRRRHGDIFTAQLGGHYFTFLTDPRSFGAVVKEARDKLDFGEFAAQLVARVFGYESEHRFPHGTHNKHLMGDGLEVMTHAMMRNLQNLMLHSLGSGEHLTDWVEEGLFMYSYNVVFRAGYLSLFGNETPQTSGGSEEKAREMDRLTSDELFCEFRKYDQLFPKLAYGILPPGQRREANRLLRVFWGSLSAQKVKAKDNVSGWVRDQQQEREDQGMDESMRDRYMFLLLWASQGNTGASAFWLLFYLMKHPDAMEAVKAEVEAVLHASGQEVAPRSGPLVELTRDMLSRTPVLDSAVEETLRLTAAPVLTRAVLRDMSLKMADGRQYAVRRGDRVALFPYTAVQTDPEVHPDPLSFKYDRFLNPDGSRKTDFYKAGKKLKYFNMPWGAGLSMCPGRFFATNELKQFIFLVLVYFDIELVDPQEQAPDIDVRRYGFGSMQPIRDVQFRYRLAF